MCDHRSGLWHELQGFIDPYRLPCEQPQQGGSSYDDEYERNLRERRLEGHAKRQPPGALPAPKVTHSVQQRAPLSPPRMIPRRKRMQEPPKAAAKLQLPLFDAPAAKKSRSRFPDLLSPHCPCPNAAREDTVKRRFADRATDRNTTNTADTDICTTSADTDNTDPGQDSDTGSTRTGT